MTPERLNELADWLVNSNAEEIADDIDNVQAIIEILQECAKCEPVYQKIFHGYQWIDCDKAAYDRDNGLKKRTLYTAPQAVKVPDETIDDCPPNHFCKAKGRAIHLPTGEACDYCGYEPKIVEVK